jgi:hypothetical protein
MIIVAGIVGHAANKFTSETEEEARKLIRSILAHPDIVLCSGRCPEGGIDIFAEEEYAKMDKPCAPYIFPPRINRWEGGYKQRNIQIAEISHVVHNILVAKYPPNYKGMIFGECYHCHTKDHVKSGGCWTLKYAKSLGKTTYQHIIRI